MTGSEKAIQQNSQRPPMSATEINAKFQASQARIRAIHASAQNEMSKIFTEKFNEIMNEAEAANSNRVTMPVPPNLSPWENVPWWMFWKDGRRRRAWRLDPTGAVWLPRWEYQHVAYVAREALENECATRTAGIAETTQAPPDRDRPLPLGGRDTAYSAHH
jgi:hypothetical protein